MQKTHSDFYGKALLMLVLAGAVLSVARAGYDTDDYENEDLRRAHAAVLIQTLSEEKTEINTLAHQQARFRQMGSREDHEIARTFGRMIRHHKAGGEVLEDLIRAHGGDPAEAKILKAPVLGTRDEMLEATHMDHLNAVRTSQARWAIARRDGDVAIMDFMNERASIARMHIEWMKPFHDH